MKKTRTEKSPRREVKRESTGRRNSSILLSAREGGVTRVRTTNPQVLLRLGRGEVRQRFPHSSRGRNLRKSVLVPLPIPLILKGKTAGEES